MRQLIIFLILTSLLLTACGAPTPNIEATVQAAIAATQTALPGEVPATTATQTPTRADTPQPAETLQGLILFVTETVSGTQVINRDLYSITGGQVKLVASNLYEKFALSPGGTMIANYGHGDSELQIIALDVQSGEANVTIHKIPDMYDDINQRYILNVASSPDSARLAVKTECSMYVLTLATGRFVEISNECYGVSLIEPGPEHIAWSPDGSQIAFDVLNSSDIPYLADYLHGGRPARLIIASADGTLYTEIDEHGAYPVWSPDGRRILYIGGWRRDDDNHRYSNEQLYVINANGTDKVQLAETVGEADDSYRSPYYENLGWSSDSARVFFIQGIQLSTIRPDGTGMVSLDELAWYATYLPQNNRIGWVGAAGDVFVSNLDGTDKLELGVDLGSATVSFSPCGVGWWESRGQWSTVSWDGNQKLQFPSEAFFSSDCTRAIFVYNNEIYITDEAGYWLRVTDEVPGHETRIIAWIP